MLLGFPCSYRVFGFLRGETASERDGTGFYWVLQWDRTASGRVFSFSFICFFFDSVRIGRDACRFFSFFFVFFSLENGRCTGCWSRLPVRFLFPYFLFWFSLACQSYSYGWTLTHTRARVHKHTRTHTHRHTHIDLYVFFAAVLNLFLSAIHRRWPRKQRPTTADNGSPYADVTGRDPRFEFLNSRIIFPASVGARLCIRFSYFPYHFSLSLSLFLVLFFFFFLSYLPSLFVCVCVCVCEVFSSATSPSFFYSLFVCFLWRAFSFFGGVERFFLRPFLGTREKQPTGETR